MRAWLKLVLLLAVMFAVVVAEAERTTETDNGDRRWTPATAALPVETEVGP